MASKGASLLVIMRTLQSLRRKLQCLWVIAGLSLSHDLLGCFERRKTGTAKNNHRMFHSGSGLVQIRFEHFQLKTNPPRFPTQ